MGVKSPFDLSFSNCYCPTMSRPLRIQYPNAWYHVMNRARRGQDLFADKKDMGLFLDLLQETTTLFNLKVSAYCLMPTHYHLLVQTPDANLARCMRHINGIYTQRYNARHQCDGTLFRGRYKSVLVDADSYLLELVRYIHRNPLRADLVKRIGRYSWSSHRGYLSNANKWEWLHKDFVLRMLAKNRAVQIRKYRRFVEKEDREPLISFYARVNLPSLLGGDKFIQWVKSTFYKGRIAKDIPQSKMLAPDGQAIIRAVCDFYDVSKSELLVIRRGVVNEPRDMAIYLQRTVCGAPLLDIGSNFGLRRYSSVSSAVHRVKRKQEKDRKLRKRIANVRKLINKGQKET